MARIHGRMPHKMCSRGCCPIGEPEEKNMMREEMELAAEELFPNPNELEDDPDWDGKLSMWDLPDDVVGVKYIPAPKDDQDG